MMTKARITYRFDDNRHSSKRPAPSVPAHEEKIIPLYNEEFRVVEDITHTRSEEETEFTEKLEFTKAESLFEAHSLNAYSTDFSNWHHPAETESDRVERIIQETSRHSEERVGSGQSPVGVRGPGPFEVHEADRWSSWTHQPQSPYVEPQTGIRYSKSTDSSWIRVVTAIAGAVVTGVAFGFFVLSMFADDPSQEAAALPDKQSVLSPAATQGAVQPNIGQGAAQDAGKQAAVSTGVAKTVSAAIPSKTYAFLQNGVFSTQQSADTAQAELSKKGLASASEQLEKVTVYVGFASSRDEVLAISQQLKDQNVEIYIKNVDIPAVSQIRWEGSKPEAVGEYISQGDKLVKMLGGLTVIQLKQASPAALEGSSMQALRTAHQAITTLATGVNEGAAESVKPALQKMNASLNRAVQSMEEYQKNPSKAMLWQAQSALMQYIISQKELLKAITV